MGSEEPIFDWLNLPAAAATLSLWDTLHDGDLRTVESNPLESSVTLRFDVEHVRDFNKLPGGTLFTIRLRGVQSVRALKTVPWPGEFSVAPGSSREVERGLVEEYQRQWREESQSWSDFERPSPDVLDVAHATVALATDAVALQVGVLHEGGSYMEIFVRAAAIECFVGTCPLSPEQFAELGKGYWEEFAKRSAESQAGSKKI